MLGLAGVPVGVMLLAAVLLALLVALDAPGAGAGLRDLEIRFPTVLRTSKGRELRLDGVLKNPGLLCKSLRAGLSFPGMLACEKPVLEVRLNREDESNRVAWTANAVERGHHTFTHCYLEGTSRLGLWHGRRTVPCHLEVRVYPDLSHERQVLAPLFFRKGAIGMHQVRQVGKGREFEQLREYAPGDSYDDIYWRGTAKRRFPVTKMFQLERTQEIYVAIDASRRSARRLDTLSDVPTEAGGMAKTQLERFIQATLVLALAAEQQTDKFGLIVFSDRVHRFIPAGGGRGHYNIIRDVLYTLQPQVVNPDYEEVFIHMGNRLRHRSLVLFLTDLGEPWLSEQFVEGISLVARKHVVLAHMLGQKEISPLFRKGDAITEDEELYGRLAGQLLWDDLQETVRLLRQRGVHLTSSLQENLVADVVNEYLRVKKRQLI
jgi:uncharacterized protein (DUF58 family)